MTGNMVRLTLPWPPSVNTYWRNVNSRVLISRKGREYRKTVIMLVLQQGVNHGLDDRLEVKVKAYPPDRRKRDIDNLSKSLLDSLSHAGVYKDDEQIDRLLIERGPVVKAGKVEVTVEVMSGES